MIGECPVNETIENYTLCVSILPTPTVKLENGSYDGIEGLPKPSVGNYNNSNGGSSYGPGDYVGGGCLINSKYSCQPTDGSLSLNLPSPRDVISTTGTATYTIPNLYESSSAPISVNSDSYSCNGWIDAANQSSGGTTSNMSCNTNNIDCSVTLSVNGGDGNGNIQFSCTASDHNATYKYVRSQGLNLTVNSITTSQSETTGPLGNLTCGNYTNYIQQNVQTGKASWKAYVSNGLNDVGGCQAPRDVFNITEPIISNTSRSVGFQYTYSCPAGYSGTIVSCAVPSSTNLKGSIHVTNSCTDTSYIKFESYTVTEPAPAGTDGEVPLGCNSFSEPNYTTPTIADGCIADHVGETLSINSSYALQYMNTTIGDYLGVGIGVISQTVSSNISIPQSGSQAIIKDQYLSGLSVSQYEATNIITDLYPTNLLLSNLPAQALFTSSLYPYDLLNVLLLQNPYFKIYGLPGFVNGSVFDYALNLFTGGTSANCIGGVTEGGYDMYNFGEGELCSGENPLANYPNGIYLSLGTLNEGLHAIEFYSVSETGNTAAPTVNVYNTVGSAYSLNAACTNGNERVFTSTYKGGKWTLNVTSDEECNTINNKLYGYIINCIYQTPGNLTFTTASKYYLGYNLPTLWNVSYTLLVSPKTYDIIPVPVYKVDASFGSYLSFTPKYDTIFNEQGLPSNYKWTITYSTQTISSTNRNITVVTAPGTYSFSVATLSNKSSTLDCTTTYTPSPAKGSLEAGLTENVTFTPSTACITTFLNTNLPSGYIWAVDYDGRNISISTSNSLSITLPAGSTGFYSYSALIEGLKCTASGTAEAGSTSTPSWSCTTKFTESGLPSGTTWTVNYNGANLSSTSTTNTFSTGAGKFVYTIYSPTVSGCAYNPSPSSGIIAAGSSQSISYTPGCTTTFTESGLPSGITWKVIYDGISQSGSSSTIQIKTGAGTFSYTVNSPSASGCTYSPSPASGSLVAGSSQSISYTGTCTTTFSESNLPSGTSWTVTYNGATKSSTSTTNTFTTGTGTFSYSVSSLSINSCTYSPSPASGSLTAGSSQSVSYTESCTTTFTESGLPSGYTWSVTYDGSTASASTGSSIAISTAPGTYTASVYVSDLSCYSTAKSVNAGGTASFSTWNCVVFFFISSGSPLPSSRYDETVTLNGVSLTANWGNNRVTLPDGQTGLEFSFGGLSPGSSYSWSVNSPINGVFGDCGTLTGYDQWNANVSSGSVYAGENKSVYYSVSCPT